jgi:hypothetical protein
MKRAVRRSYHLGDIVAARALERTYHKMVRAKQRAAKVSRLQSFVDDHKQGSRRFWNFLHVSHVPLPPALQTVQAWSAFHRKAANAGEVTACEHLPTLAYPQRPLHPVATLNEAITEREVIEAIPQLNNGRAPGLQGYPAELLRYARPEHKEEDREPPPPHILAPYLMEVFNCAFHAGKVPQPFNGSLLSPVYKKGDDTDTSNYRPIAVTEPLMRLYAVILNNRLLKFTEENNLRVGSQTGFRPGLSTVHQLFALQHLVDKQAARGAPLFVCFLDLKSAYDRVPRHLLWQVLARLGVHGRMLDAIQSLYTNCDITLKVGNSIGDTLPSCTGVKQGCPLSPTLFGLFADGLHRHLLSVCPSAGFQVDDTTSVLDLEFADDFDLLSESPAGLQQLIDEASHFFTSIGMQISVEKTKIMVFGKRLPIPYTWFCDGRPLEVVIEYKSLGLVFTATPDGFVQTFARLKRRMWLAWATLKKQYGKLQCASSIWLLLRLYSACVPPTASYGCELWAPYRVVGKARNYRNALESSHLQMLRSVCGTRSTVSTDILLHELSAQPLSSSWLLRAARFWNNLATLPCTSLHHKLALDACRDAVCHNVKNWAWGMLHSLKAVGYVLTVRVDTMECIDLGCLEKKLERRQSGVWDKQHVCPRTCPSIGAKLCTYYRWFFPSHRPYRLSSHHPHVLRLPLSTRRMRQFLRFRMGCHGLPRDNAGWGPQRVPRMHRTCQKCTSGQVGDERHLVFECTALQPIRNKYADLFRVAPLTMRQFMWQPDLLRVALFVVECMDYMHNTGSDDESDI